jgi:hypothetical protein
MSNYYISKCCKVPVDIISMEAGSFRCQKCNKKGCEVTAIIDTPDGVPKETLKTTCLNINCPERTGGECNAKVPELSKEEIMDRIGYQEDIKAGVDVSGVPREEPHNTEDGWCCACEYDIIELNRRITAGVKKGVEEERKSTIEFINKLLKISEVYVPFQKIHYQSALSDLLSELNKQEK